jgi:AsmA-like protein
MSRLRKYGGITLLIFALFIVAQVGVSFLVRTQGMRGYLIAHLESAFGRPVQAGEFSVQLLPMPELEVDAITIGEDPAFGHEYFLRAERMTARLRWSGLLRGHFQFGTMSLTRPSLILVRNVEGRWNLEGWLPPARAKAPSANGAANPEPTPESTNRLERIEFDEGRINFKIGVEKRPFAFTNVSGNVEQVSPGRWQLRLEAEPWRSGVALQSTGTLQVAGYVAGTSVRMQPAELRVHWGKVSIADLFRLITGNDSGVRGEFALDGNASVGLPASGADGGPQPWRFQIQARAAQIHRWDLTERGDNPRVNVNVKGIWSLAASEARAEELRVELPHSSLEGSAALQTVMPGSWHTQFKRMTLQADDLLAWYRAFQPGISDGVSVDEFITGDLTAGGWPLKWEAGQIAGRGGTLQIPGLRPARIGPFHGVVRDGKFNLDGPRVKFAVDAAAQAADEKSEKGATKARAIGALENNVEAALLHDSVTHQSGLRLNIRLADSSPLFKLASAFGHKVNPGWEYSGGAAGTVNWNWGYNKEAHRSGSLELTKAQLQVAGLNQPLKIGDARLEWVEGRRNATIGNVEAFGAAWSGTVSEVAPGGVGEGPSWKFQLRADRLDATELDRWFGPRARPNWLQRLLPTLLGGTNTTTQASELLRQVSAEGELNVDSLTVEKVKLAQVHGFITLHNLQMQVRDAEAQWAGGTVKGEVEAQFSSLPKYDVTAEVAGTSLSQLPWAPRWAERWSGTASGKLRLTTNGVGREDLLKQLAGEGDFKLSKIEFRGWDVASSADSGTLRTGASRWASGEGKFEVRERMIRLNGLQLDNPHQRTMLSGTIGFDMKSELAFRAGTADKKGTKNLREARELNLTGSLESPRAVVQAAKVAATTP